MPDIFLKAWPYITSVAPAGTPVAIADMRLYLIDPPVADNALITALVNAAGITCEQLTRLTLETATFITFRNGFSESPNFVSGGNNPIVLRKNPIVDATVVIQYLVSDVLVTVDAADYFIEATQDWLTIRPVLEWPSDGDIREQSVKITFNAGSATVADNLQTAIKQHVASMYENRGDADKAMPSLLPTVSKLIYNQVRIIEV